MTGLLDICDFVKGPTLEVYGGEESLMPSRMRRSLTSILSCTGVKCAWKALPRPPMAVAARPLEAVAATLGCGGATCEQFSQFNFTPIGRLCSGSRVSYWKVERGNLPGFLPRLRLAFIGKKAVTRWRHEWESSSFLRLVAL